MEIAQVSLKSKTPSVRDEPLVYICNMKIMLKSTASWDVKPEKSTASIFREEEKTERGKSYADTGRSGLERTDGSEEMG